MKFNFGIILTTSGIFGGAERRFTNLFKYFYERYPENAYYFVSYDLFERIKRIYPDYPLNNVIPIGKKAYISIKQNLFTSVFKSGKTSAKISYPRKIYRFIRNYRLQKGYYKEIEKYRDKFNITVFMGVSCGILPLYFYLKRSKREVGIIFCDMDSWFRDIYPKEKKYWYKKYSSFNYALENSDYIDFLSPFILEGVRERGIKVKDESVSITPCSFTEYSKCKFGNKHIFQVAFSGRLEQDKNPELYLKAAIQLSNKYPEIIFHIMGEGRLASLIKEKVERSGSDKIIFHGFHPNPTNILADTSVFVSIQTTNNYPSQSVLEAMACGNAIVATDVGDTRMFINEKNGVLINLELVELINSIQYFLNNKSIALKMGSYASEYVRANHTIEKAADYYIKLFQKQT